jgi:hypothetical protein
MSGIRERLGVQFPRGYPALHGMWISRCGGSPSADESRLRCARSRPARRFEMIWKNCLDSQGSIIYLGIA